MSSRLVNPPRRHSPGQLLRRGGVCDAEPRLALGSCGVRFRLVVTGCELPGRTGSRWGIDWGEALMPLGLLGRGQDKQAISLVLRARSLAPLGKARGFGMTQAF